MVDITVLLSNMNIEEILPKGENNDWVKLNSSMYKDIIIASDKNNDLTDNDINIFLRMVNDEYFLEIIQPPFEKKGYTLVDRHVFNLMSKGDIENDTFIFVNESYYNRLLIKGFARYEWVLKAMSVDYSKYIDKELMYTYKEYFEGNTRLMDQLFKEKKCTIENQMWLMDFEHNLLYYRLQKKRIQWSKEEAESKFKNLQEGI